MEKQFTIMVVEDDTNINNLLKTALEKAGYQVLQAFSGTEGRTDTSDEGIHCSCPIGSYVTGDFRRRSTKTYPGKGKFSGDRLNSKRQFG